MASPGKRGGQRDVKNAGRPDYVHENTEKVKIENDRPDYVDENKQVIRYLQRGWYLIEKR